MSGLTVSCPVAALGSMNYGKNTYADIYKELTKTVDEQLILGIQLYPSGWPRKLQVAVGNIDIKNKIIIEGLDLFGIHVEFGDDNSVLTKVVMRDAPMDWSNNYIMDNMSRFGDVVRVEKEMLYIDGRKTNCTTGTRFIYMSKIIEAIPGKLEVKLGIKSFTLSVWYRGQNSNEQIAKSCTLCGSDSHDSKSCTHAKKVCFLCKESDHAHKDCPRNDGTKRSDETLVFYNSKCTLSNWNREYPFKTDGKEYLCVEQFVMAEKCLMFGDTEAADEIMNETDPKRMRQIGEDIRSYDHRVWLSKMNEVVHAGVYAKFSYEGARGAREHLLGTGKLTIGEATRNRKWGTGIHVSEPQALNRVSWMGENIMGEILMNVRDMLTCEHTGKNGEKPNNDSGGKPGNGSDDGGKPGNNNVNGEKPGDIDDTCDDSFLKHLDSDPDNSTSLLNGLPYTSSQKMQWAVVIGDSNITGLALTDENVPMNVRPCAKGGTTLAHIPDRLSQCDLENEQVDILVLHVGTCEWDYETDPDEASAVYDRYMDVLNVTSTQYARAEVIISGIPYRNPIGNIKEKAEQINEQITSLNARLEGLAQNEDNIRYIDNIDRIPIDAKLYKDSVHLNDKGRHILADNLKNAIRETYAQIALNLGNDWKDSSTPK